MLAIVGTTVIAYIVKAVVGLRPSEEVEVAGLDLAEHGEEGYHAGNWTNKISRRCAGLLREIQLRRSMRF